MEGKYNLLQFSLILSANFCSWYFNVISFFVWLHFFLFFWNDICNTETRVKTNEDAKIVIIEASGQESRLQHTHRTYSEELQRTEFALFNLQSVCFHFEMHICSARSFNVQPFHIAYYTYSEFFLPSAWFQSSISDFHILPSATHLLDFINCTNHQLVVLSTPYFCC